MRDYDLLNFFVLLNDSSIDGSFCNREFLFNLQMNMSFSLYTVSCYGPMNPYKS